MWSFLSSFCLDVWSQDLESGLSQLVLRDALVPIQLLEATEIEGSLVRVGHTVLPKTVWGWSQMLPHFTDTSFMYVKPQKQDTGVGEKSSLSTIMARSTARVMLQLQTPIPRPSGDAVKTGGTWVWAMLCR